MDPSSSTGLLVRSTDSNASSPTQQHVTKKGTVLIRRSRIAVVALVLIVGVLALASRGKTDANSSPVHMHQTQLDAKKFLAEHPDWAKKVFGDIRDGHNAPRGSAPFMVGLIHWPTAHLREGFHCGGALIRPSTASAIDITREDHAYYVLTASHCTGMCGPDRSNPGKEVWMPYAPDELTVVAGVVDKTEKNTHLTVASAITRFATSIDCAGRGIDDVAVLKLKKPFPVGEAVENKILVASLPLGTSVKPPASNTNLIIFGWGRLADGRKPDNMQFTTVQRVDHTTCQQNFGSTFDPTKDFCAGAHPRTGSTRTGCKGDSGGPAILDGNPLVPPGVTVVGIQTTSMVHRDPRDRRCKSKPSLYANVAYFRDQIDRAIAGFQTAMCRAIADFE